MRCHSCGTEVREGQKFCMECGASLRGDRRRHRRGPGRADRDAGHRATPRTRPRPLAVVPQPRSAVTTPSDVTAADRRLGGGAPGRTTIRVAEATSPPVDLTTQLSRRRSHRRAADRAATAGARAGVGTSSGRRPGAYARASPAETPRRFRLRAAARAGRCSPARRHRRRRAHDGRHDHAAAGRRRSGVRRQRLRHEQHDRRPDRRRRRWSSARSSGAPGTAGAPGSPAAPGRRSPGGPRSCSALPSGGSTSPRRTPSRPASIGYWALGAAGALGIVVLVGSLAASGRDRRGGLDPWIAALAAVSFVIAAGGPLIPEGDRRLGRQLDAVTTSGRPADDVLRRAGRAARAARRCAASLGCLLVRRWGLGLAVGGALADRLAARHGGDRPHREPDRPRLRQPAVPRQRAARRDDRRLRAWPGSSASWPS